ADLGCGQRRLSLRAPPSRPHACDPLGVEAVRAALEERERAVRESADAVCRRLGYRLELGERRDLDAQRDGLPRGEERELAFLLPLGGGGGGGETEAVDAQDQPPARAPARMISRGPAPARSSSSGPSRSSTHPIGVSASAARLGSIDPETISRSIARVIAT